MFTPTPSPACRFFDAERQRYYDAFRFAACRCCRHYCRYTLLRRRRRWRHALLMPFSPRRHADVRCCYLLLAFISLAMLRRFRLILAALTLRRRAIRHAGFAAICATRHDITPLRHCRYATTTLPLYCCCRLLLHTPRRYCRHYLIYVAAGVAIHVAYTPEELRYMPLAAIFATRYAAITRYTPLHARCH